MTAIAEPTTQARFTTIDGLRIRYADSGDDQETQALLFSPWPESLFAFHLVWPRLAEQAHLLAVDLPGFGHSERPASLLTPRDMGRFIVRVADEFGLDEPHVVGPDVATGASLFAAIDNPGRIRSLVVGSGGVVVSEFGGVLDEWVTAPDLDAYRKLDPRAIVGAGITSRGYPIPPAIAEDYLSAYDGDRFVEVDALIDDVFRRSERARDGGKRRRVRLSRDRRRWGSAGAASAFSRQPRQLGSRAR